MSQSWSSLLEKTMLSKQRELWCTTTENSCRKVKQFNPDWAESECWRGDEKVIAAKMEKKRFANQPRFCDTKCDCEIWSDLRILTHPLPANTFYIPLAGISFSYFPYVVTSLEGFPLPLYGAGLLMWPVETFCDIDLTEKSIGLFFFFKLADLHWNYVLVVFTYY